MSRLVSDEGIKYYPYIKKRGRDAGLDYLEVGIYVTLPDGAKHAVRLVPSTSTGEGEGTGNVFVYEDEEAFAHIAWVAEGSPAER